MTDSEKCSCESSQVLLFPCSGGSNVGQIANAAAVRLTRDGCGRMYCLAGLGGHVSGIVESTRSAPLRVAIDGCPVRCATATLRRFGMEPEVSVIVTELGIGKNKDFDLPLEHVTGTCAAVVARIAEESG